MKTTAILFAIGAALALTPALVLAQDEQGAEEPAAQVPEFEVAERDEAGKVTKVLHGGRVYDICVEEGQDSCINPRDAGLDFGARELDYWPGRPASQIDEPLPATPPAPSENEEPTGFEGAFTDLNEPAAR